MNICSNKLRTPHQRLQSLLKTSLVTLESLKQALPQKPCQPNVFQGKTDVYDFYEGPIGDTGVDSVMVSRNIFHGVTGIVCEGATHGLAVAYVLSELAKEIDLSEPSTPSSASPPPEPWQYNFLVADKSKRSQFTYFPDGTVTCELLDSEKVDLRCDAGIELEAGEVLG